MSFNNGRLKVQKMLNANQRFSTLSFDYHRVQMRILKQIEHDYLKSNMACSTQSLDLKIPNNKSKSPNTFRRISDPEQIGDRHIAELQNALVQAGM